jgi:ankyrin repeat protein
MPTHSDAIRLNLEFYKKQAKSLLKSAQAREDTALARIARHANQNNELPALHHAQLTIAREQGFPSWPKFQSFIKQSQLDFQGQVAAFIDAATSDYRRAESLLAQHPQIAHAGFYVALVLGDHQHVAQAVTGSPALAKEKGGPQNCEPLLYVCVSRYANPRNDQARAAALTETAGILLGHGANADAVVLADDPPHSPLSCLYGASGLNNNLALTEVLLNAGANPNDNESLYHSTEHEDLACMRLLLARGARPAATNALKHMLDRDHFEGLRLLLAAGVDPNETNECGETALHWAVWRGRSTPVIAALLDAGAGINAQRKDGRTAYSLAVLGDRTETIELLRSRGADTRLSPLDQFVQSCGQATPAELDRFLATRPDFSGVPGSGRLLPDLAVSHSTQAVRALLAAGVPIDSRGEWGATALHWACWKGYADIVRLLLDQGATLTIEDEQFHATPSGWFSHGVQNCEERQGDYPEVARLLIAAKANFNPTDLPTGSAEVDAIFRGHNLLQVDI